MVSVVLVNWNTRDLTLQCIKSIKKDCTDLPLEIIVSDNDSSDDSVKAIREKHPDVVVLENGVNFGFAKGNNIGIARCKGDFVCLVNTDVKVLPGCFSALLHHMKENPLVGLSAPQALNGDMSLQITAKREITWRETIARVLWLDSFLPKLSYHDHHKTGEVDVVAGCFWMIRREALEQVGGLDEAFYFYGEDKDYCKRMKLAGWKVMFNPEAKIIHYAGSSSKSATYKYYIQLERAINQYWRKYHGRFSSSAYYLSRILYQLIRMTGNGVASALTLGRKKQSVHKMLRSWYCLIWMLTGKELKAS